MSTAIHHWSDGMTKMAEESSGADTAETILHFQLIQKAPFTGTDKANPFFPAKAVLDLKSYFNLPVCTISATIIVKNNL